jgi:hypothetical protein
MAAFLWETGVVNDPGIDRAVRLNAGSAIWRTLVRTT